MTTCCAQRDQQQQPAFAGNNVVDVEDSQGAATNDMTDEDALANARQSANMSQVGAA